MKHRFLAILLSLAATCGAAFGLSACGTAVGISSAEINDKGELVITYTDGTQSNLGKVKGEDGSKGDNGNDGVGVKDAYVDEYGNLIVELTDGTQKDCGKVKGEDGKDGENGKDASGLKGAYTDEDGNIIFVLADGKLASGDLLYKEALENEKPVGYSVAGLNRPSAKNIVIPERIDGLPVIGVDDNAFYECERIVSVQIPSTVKTIGELAFYHCTSLESATFSEGLEIIGDYSFYECYKLKSADIPASVKIIGECAFSACESLKTLTLREGLETIRDCAFGGCCSLENFIMPDSVTSIGWGMLIFGGGVGFGEAVDGSNNISTVKISSALTVITDHSFSGCSMKSIKLGENVNTVEYSAFYGCAELESVIIPKSVKKITSYAFYRCPALTSVYYEGTSAEWKGVTVGRSGNEFHSSEQVRDFAKVYYYSATPPAFSGNYWHYSDGVPVKW